MPGSSQALRTRVNRAYPSNGPVAVVIVRRVFGECRWLLAFGGGSDVSMGVRRHRLGTRP